MKKRSLQKIIVTYALICVAFMIATVSAFLYYNYYTTRQYILSSYDGLSSHLKSNFTAAISSIQTTVTNSSYANAVQICAFTDDPGQFLRMRDTAVDTLTLLDASNEYSTGLFVLSDTIRSLYSVDAPVTRFRSIWGFSYAAISQNISSSTGRFILTDQGTQDQLLWYASPFYNRVSGYFDKNQESFCLLLCDFGPLTENLKISTDFNSGIVLLYSGQIVSESRPLTEIEKSIIADIKDISNPSSSNRSDYLIKTISLPQNGWQLVFLTPEMAITSQAVQLGAGSLITLIIFIFLNVLFVVAISYIASRPVRKILDDMRRIRNNVWDSQISDSRIHEFSEIVSGINLTLNYLHDAYKLENESQERLYQSVIAQNKAKYDAYRMQINPHFLFNTLECARSMASQYGVEPVEEIIGSLSSMFRYTFQAEDFVHLKDEIAHLKDFINVMNIRYSGRFNLRVVVDDERLLNWRVCSMILQPLAENSIHHGFTRRSPPFNMLLQCMTTEDGRVLIRFTDNGNGIEPEKVALLEREFRNPADEPKHKIIGLTNINYRLRLISTSNSGLSIRSIVGHYTSVSFLIDQDSGRWIASGQTD